MNDAKNPGRIRGWLKDLIGVISLFALLYVGLAVLT